MKRGTKKLGGLLTAATIAVGAIGLLGAQGCDDEGGPLGDIAKQCGLECSDKGVAQGNFAITGEASIDGFFKSVVNFKNVAAGVAADINAELKGIQLDFGITDAELKAAGSAGLGGALKAKIQGKAELKVDAQPAKCEVDAKLSVEASAQCQATAGCDVDPGQVSVQCMGKCSVDVEAGASCEGELSCEVSGPSVECQGSCSGSCTVELTAAGKCDGACNGTCDGSTSDGASCAGMCEGSCELSGSAAANCTGKCEGTCKGTPPAAGCNGKLQCEAMLNAMAECKGSCEGEFQPPSVQCDASASCEASAKADAKFAAKCTPPSVDIKFSFDASADAAFRGQFEYGVSQLKVRLPRLLAALEKSDLVVDASAELLGTGKAAVEGFAKTLADGDASLAVAFKVGKCAPAQLEAAAAAIAAGGEDLSAQVSAAVGVTASLGMGG